MNQFIQEAKYLVYKHGLNVTYTAVVEGVYDVDTSSVTNTETSNTIKVFPKRIKATQYNYPNLVSKQVVEFLVIASDLPSIPGNQDKIVFQSETYSVYTYSEHFALGEKVLYKIIAAKG